MKKNGCFARKKPTLFVDDLIKNETIPAREERERDGGKGRGRWRTALG